MATRKRDRVIALGIALFFFLLASGLSIMVIVQAITSKNNSQSTNTNQTSQQNQQTNNCTDNSAEPTLSAPSVYTTASVKKLQTTDLAVGTGAAAKSGDCLVVKYYGTLANNGKKFDENYTKPNAFAFKLGGGQVIKGWDEGMAGMKVGGTRRLVIPADMAYGKQSPSSAIPPNSDLVFTVKLLRIQ